MVTLLGRPTPQRTPECQRCGEPLVPRTRKGATVCRVCATRSSYAFLTDALANRRRRPALALQ